MYYLNETYKAVAIIEEETLYNFAENLQYKDHLYRIKNKLDFDTYVPVIHPNRVKPKWVWRVEKPPLTYKSVGMGNVLQMVKSNYWGRKIAFFYSRMKVMRHLESNF